MKNLTKTALIMFSIIVMMSFSPNAFANTVTEENTYKQCKHDFVKPEPGELPTGPFPQAYMTTKTSVTTLNVTNQGTSTYGDPPTFKLETDFPQFIRQANGTLCLPLWELQHVYIQLRGWHSLDENGAILAVTCYENTLTAKQYRNLNETIACAADAGFGWYMNNNNGNGRDMYLVAVPSYLNMFTGERSDKNLDVYLTGTIE